MAGGLDVGADRDALAVYCCAVADYAQAQQMLDQTGPVIRDARGSVKRNPMAMVKAANAATIRQMARDLGLRNARPELEEPPERRTYRNQAATERTLTGLRRVGRLDEPDAGLVALARHLAEALDRIDPARFPAQTASLARVQLATLQSLRGHDDEQPTASGGVDDLLAFLSAPVGDSPDP
jgi:P27 family predicted phage terminase small subunit